ncbi:AlpA family transcriptional regulator [Gammaproteobacteria bacterium]|nr:AlpA family transcriptional regulator [Gammaproteobacteria bacterium]
MQEPIDDHLAKIADSMGISLYQRFSSAEAALFLRCDVMHLKSLIAKEDINLIQLPGGKVEFFGYQLLQFLLGQVTEHPILAQTTNNDPDRILRAAEVQSLTSLSRTTLWRMEKRGDFPQRISLGVGAVGWRWSEVERWINSRAGL